MGKRSIEPLGNYGLIRPDLQRKPNTFETIVTGQQTHDLLCIHLSMTGRESILDAGCGDGRVAAAFCMDQGFIGRYTGFDPNLVRVSELRLVYQNKPQFSFDHLDLYHSYYNPAGSMLPEHCEYPYPDQAFDIVFYNSVFSHTRFAAIVASLREARRCLRDSGGRVFVTGYCIDGTASGKRWSFAVPYDRGFAAEADVPESALAFPKDVFLEAFEQAGLTMVNHVPGYWIAERQHSLDQAEQDIFILRKSEG